MESRHLFRGKDANKKWIYGNLIYWYDDIYERHHYTINESNLKPLGGGGMSYKLRSCYVDPVTVGQCTGLSAYKSYREVNLCFEGDIVKDDTNIAVVRFGHYVANNNKSYVNEESYGFYLEYTSHPGLIDHICGIEGWEIVGTIHDI